MRPTWAEISLGRLVENYRLLRHCAPGAELISVIKADAYGHGVLACGRALAAAGARWLGVTDVAEAVALRAVCPTEGGTEILVMSGLWAGEAAAVVEHRLVPQVWEPYHFKLLQEAAGADSIRVHVEVDTGMSRQGMPPDMLGALLDEYARPPIVVEALLTHFSAPEVRDGTDTALQMGRFSRALEVVRTRCLRLKYVHAGNSANVLRQGELRELAALAAGAGAQLMMRPGLALYGYPVRFMPGESDSGPASALRPVLTWKTRITSLRMIQPGTGAGYNSTFVAGRTTRLALVPVGYADGLNRLLSNRGAMLVRGQRAPIAGRISMDQTMLDVTDVPEASIGDEVVIVGEQGDRRISAYDHADLCGTIPYEILCNISARVPRVEVE